MLFIYNCLLYVTLPFLPLRLLWRGRKNSAYRARWRERFALYAMTPQSVPLSQSIWIHAVSFGEAVAATPLVRTLQQKYPQLPLVFTVMTPTGAAHVAKTFGNQKQIIPLYVPYDYPGAVYRFLDYANPKFLLIMETELWPNILHSCAARRIPVFLVNARLTERSLRGYSKIRRFTKSMLANIDLICAQSQKDAAYFLQLGAASQRVVVTGNIKFDITLPENIVARGAALRCSLGRDSIWIAASTHPGEEELVLAAHTKVLQQIPSALLILVPRHIERAAAIAALCTASKMNVMRYMSPRTSAQQSGKPKCDGYISSNDATAMTQANVLLVETMGQLLLFYAAADVAFVGGSLVPIGGHNVLEAAALAKPIIVGMHTESLADIRVLLENAHGLIGVQNSDDLAEQVVRLLKDKNLRQQYGAAAQKIVAQNRGVIEKIMERLSGACPTATIGQ